jgi:hypothetical protein
VDPHRAVRPLSAAAVLAGVVLLGGAGWEPVAATGHPDRYFSVVAAGEGVLVFSGPSGAGVVADGEYRVSDWPVAHADLRRLAGGTLVGRVGEDIYLGIGNGLQRRWISVVMTRM